jgi:hypothetical protein
LFTFLQNNSLIKWAGTISAHPRWLDQVKPKPIKRERERDCWAASRPNPTKSGWSRFSPTRMAGPGPTPLIIIKKKTKNQKIKSPLKKFLIFSHVFLLILHNIR